MKLNKEDLIKAVAGNANITKVQAEQEIKNVLTGIEACLEQLAQVKEGERKFQILNYFTVIATYVPEHVGKNPRTKEPVEVAGAHRIKIKAGKVLKDAINSNN